MSSEDPTGIKTMSFRSLVSQLSCPLLIDFIVAQRSKSANFSIYGR